jgi:replicative DNA helicase
MRTKCQRIKHEFGIDLVILDYLQLMHAPGYNNNRVQEISYISRHMKELARELNVPLLSAAQLSRAVEQRSDKRPQLSDLRESGCLAGESRVWLPDEGRCETMRNLNGKRDFRVLALNTETYCMEPATVSNAFSTGVKPVYRMATALGRSIRATGNHKFLTIHGWKRLDELQPGDRVALPNVNLAQPVGRPEGRPYTAHRRDAILRVQHTTTHTAAAVASLVGEIATSDVYWDKITDITPDGETEVYDLTVPGYANFVAQNIVVHNSIEQDADIVMFLYRDEMAGVTKLAVEKHRNGPTGIIDLVFRGAYTQFENAAAE